MVTRISTLEQLEDLICQGVIIASEAQIYYRQPKNLNGGGKSFLGFNSFNTVIESLDTKILTEIVGNDKMIIICKGNKIGRDGKNTTKIILTVTPTEIETRITN